MASNFTDIGQLRFWCQKILPLVYDDSLSYYELLCKVVEKLNLVIQNVDGLPEYIGELISEDKIKPILDELIDNIRSNIAVVNEKDSPTATGDRHTGELLWWKDNLYEVVRDMNIGDAYIDYSSNPNIKHVTIEELISNLRVNVVNLQGKVDTEITDRENADNTLQGNIDAEATARENADSGLQASINTISEKLKYVYTVKDFGAVGDGITDDAQAFADCIANTKDGGWFLVPEGIYNLSFNPNPTNRNITMLCNNTVKFTGTGIGNPSSYAGTFDSPLTNPGNVVSGDKSIYNIEGITNPVGNGVVASSREIDQTNALNYIDVTGTLNNGSSTLQVNSTEGIERGDGVLLVSPTSSLFPSGDTRSNTMRVVSVDSSTSITIGLDNSGGNGNAVPTNWNGASIINGQFRIRKRKWQVVDFTGLKAKSEKNPDRINWVHDSILELRGCEGNVYEIELDIKEDTTPICRGVLITGKGKANGQLCGINIIRADYEASQNWMWGLAINNCAIGAEIKASQAIVIGSKWNDAYSQKETELYTGITFDNLTPLTLNVRPLFAGKQIVNGATAILLQRNSDDSSTGYYLQFMNSDATQNIFVVDTNGGVTCTSLNAGSGTVTMGLPKFIQRPQDITTEVANGYITALDADGNTIKILVAK